MKVLTAESQITKSYGNFVSLKNKWTKQRIKVMQYIHPVSDMGSVLYLKMKIEIIIGKTNLYDERSDIVFLEYCGIVGTAVSEPRSVIVDVFDVEYYNTAT